MEPLSQDSLNAIARERGIVYEALPHEDPLTVHSRLSKAFPVSQESMFDAFSDPVAHVGLFQIIKDSTPPIRNGLTGVLPENQFLAFEHVQESNLPPRIMLVRYTLDRPNLITKEALTDPFDIDIAADKKKGLVLLKFDRIDDEQTNFTAESTFHAETGSVFARGFVDRVWMNFFERMMFANGQITEDQFLT